MYASALVTTKWCNWNLQKPVEEWPVCDCLISFHSKGFPLEKAIQYAQLHNPYVINNLHMQYDIQDRRKVYATLENEGIEIPRYAVLDRDSSDPKRKALLLSKLVSWGIIILDHELVESEDHVEVNGVVFNKPFVEKPVSAEDHNIYIYYPTSAGGGSQRLFRKVVINLFLFLCHHITFAPHPPLSFVQIRLMGFVLFSWCDFFMYFSRLSVTGVRK